MSIKLKSIFAALILVTGLCSCSQKERRIEVDRDIVFAETTDYRGLDIKLKLDVYHAEKSGDEARAAIIWVHGGGMYVGSKDAKWGLVSYLADEMAKRNYVFFSIDYRLNPEWEATGAFAPTIRNAALDVASAVDWVKANAVTYGADPERIILMGHSAGAEIISNYYYSNALTPDSLYDKSGITALIPISGNRLFYDGDSCSGKGQAKCLIMHGDLDDINPLSDAEILLKQIGDKGQLSVMNGNGHMWTENDEQKTFVVDNILSFLSEIL